MPDHEHPNYYTDDYADIDELEHGDECNFQVNSPHDGAVTEVVCVLASEELLPPLPLAVLERSYHLVDGDTDEPLGLRAMLPEDFEAYFPSNTRAVN